MPSEEEVAAGASVIARSQLIDAPKLPADNWQGLARSILEAAETVRDREEQEFERRPPTPKKVVGRFRLVPINEPK